MNGIKITNLEIIEPCYDFVECDELIIKDYNFDCNSVCFKIIKPCYDFVECDDELIIKDCDFDYNSVCLEDATLINYVYLDIGESERGFVSQGTVNYGLEYEPKYISFPCINNDIYLGASDSFFSGDIVGKYFY